MSKLRSARSNAAAPRARGGHAWLLAATLAFVFAFWWGVTGGDAFRASHWAHYTYLADAFWHGQLHLWHHPDETGDMALVNGRAYVVFGPLPAVLLMPLTPFLARQTPDVFVLIVTALAGAWAFFALIRRVLPDLGNARLACATLAFALGTAIGYGAPIGNVWLHAQITATALQVAALWAASSRRAWLAGVLLGLTVLTRSTVTLAAPLAAWMLWKGADDAAPAAAGDAGERGELPLGRVALALGVPIALAAGLHAAYNAARFGSPMDAGYHYILMGPEFETLVKTYGRFHPHFLAHNLYGWLLRPPLVLGGRLVPDAHGMSLLLTTPYLALAAWPRRWTKFELVAALTALAIALPSLLYYNDGWSQFGQRFALDWIALGLLVASFGARRAPAWLVALLTAWSIAVTAWGLQWFWVTQLH